MFLAQISILVATALLLSPAFSIAEEAPWQLQKESDEIFVYARSVEGSSYNAVKATMLIEASPERLSKLIGDGDGCPEWRAMCEFSEVIENASAHERYVYTVLDLPWPASDRDMVLHTKAEIDTGTKTATVYLQSDSMRYSSYEDSSGYVRAQTIGRMVIHAVSDQQIEFTYVMHTELGGSLPASRVNAGLTDGAIEDLSRLKRLAER
ncbi:MAG: START domain-containing protein [Halioglobus sp.]|nr:START domain-containing protein [Halioglobus sp.]